MSSSKNVVLAKLVSQGQPFADGIIDASEIQNFSSQVRNSISGSNGITINATTGAVSISPDILIAYSLILG